MRFSRWFTFVPVLLLALFIPVSRVKADALGNWTASQSCITGSVDVVDNSIVLYGPDGGGCQGSNWVKIETVIPEGVDTVDFTWAYQTFDGWVYDPPQYAVNGNYVLLTQENDATGSLSIPVVEGDVFTFRQYSTDSCCQPGNLTISNLSLWTAAQTTTTTSILETTTTEESTTTTSTTSSLPQTTLPESTTTTTQPLETTTSTSLPNTTEIPQTTTATTLPTSSSSSSSSSSQPQTTTTLEETTTTSVTPTTIPTTPSTPPTTVWVPTGTTTTIVEEPLEIPQPLEDLPTTTETSIELEPTFETPPTTIVEPLPQDTEMVVDEPILDTILDAIIEEPFTPDASAEEVSAAIDEILTSDVSFEQLESVVDAVFTQEASVEVMSAALESLVSADLSLRELATVLDSVFDADLSDEATIELVQQVLDQPLSTEEFKTVLNAIFDEQISDEVLVETFTAVLDTPLTEERFAEVVDVLSSDAITNDQVAQVVDLVIGQEGGVASEQAVELVSSAKVLESVSGEQATEVFGSVDEGALTVENGEEITAAVQEAPVEVRDAFQEEINVFGGVFDGYYPLDSMIDVGTRRVVVAGTGVLISAPVVASRRVRV